MRASTISLTVLAALTMLFASPAAASSQPPSPPDYFYGTLKIDGADAPAGTAIEAKVPGVLNGIFNPITTNQIGRYSDPEPPFTYGLLVQGDIAEGSTIEFFVNGVKANETAAWHSGQFTMLNLTAGTAIPALSVSTGAFSRSGPTAAIVYGSLSQMGGVTAVAVSFQWGTTQAYGKETVAETMNVPGAFSATLTGLLSNTIYHYRVKAVTGQTVVYGADQAFTTGVATLLSVNTGVASSISTTTTILNGSLTQLTNATSAQVNFQWGTTQDYSNETVPQTMNAPGAFSSSLTGLLPDTVYHYRAKAVTGQTAEYGADLTFRTTALTPSGSSFGGVGGSVSGVTGGGGLFTVPLTGLSGIGPLVDGASGKTLNSVRVKTVDDKLSIDIATGTKILDKVGLAITSLTATPLATSPPSLPGEAILIAYDLGPSGAQFAPALSLSISFDPTKVPAGLSLSKLYLAWWNGDNWVKLDSAVDPATSTITAQISHFTEFAVIAGLEPAAGQTEPPVSEPETEAAPAQEPAPPTSSESPSLPTPPSTSEAQAPATPPSTPAASPSPGATQPSTNGWLIGGIIVAIVIVTIETFLLLRRRAARD